MDWWTSGARSGDCDTLQHLLCFELGSGPASVFPPITGKRMFVTSARIGLSDAQLTKEPLAGGLFEIDPGVIGLPTQQFAG